jgi:hypothetical protein
MENCLYEKIKKISIYGFPTKPIGHTVFALLGAIKLAVVEWWLWALDMPRVER